MASVLNKVTKVYMQSVNTPDYPETDWLINPDLAAVLDIVPQKYWFIEEGQTQVGEDPETLEPIYATTYSVRAMTTEEQSAYDLANPAPADPPARATISLLADGTPAYEYNGKLISVSSQSLDFATKTNGTPAKKFNLLYQGSTDFYKAVRKIIIKKLAAYCKSDTEFTINIKADSDIIGTFDCIGVGVFNDISSIVPAGSKITVSIVTSVSVSDPSVQIETAFVD